ncbi:MAG: hypothetical protein QXY39_02875 [Thermofilaceae archaeon]
MIGRGSESPALFVGALRFARVVLDTQEEGAVKRRARTGVVIDCFTQRLVEVGQGRKESSPLERPSRHHPRLTPVEALKSLFVGSE